MIVHLKNQLPADRTPERTLMSKHMEDISPTGD
jgi:hypothetical protein